MTKLSLYSKGSKFDSSGMTDPMPLGPTRHTLWPVSIRAREIVHRVDSLPIKFEREGRPNTSPKDMVDPWSVENVELRDGGPISERNDGGLTSAVPLSASL